MSAAEWKCIKTAGLKLYVLPWFFFPRSTKMPSSFFRGWRPWTRASSSLPARCREKSGPERLPCQANLVPKIPTISNRRFSYMFAPAATLCESCARREAKAPEYGALQTLRAVRLRLCRLCRAGDAPYLHRFCLTAALFSPRNLQCGAAVAEPNAIFPVKS